MQHTINIHTLSQELPLLNSPTEQFIVWTEKGAQLAHYDEDGFYNTRGKIINGAISWMRVPDPGAEAEEQPRDRALPVRHTRRSSQAYPLMT